MGVCGMSASCAFRKEKRIGEKKKTIRIEMSWPTTLTPGVETTYIRMYIYLYISELNAVSFDSRPYTFVRHPKVVMRTIRRLYTCICILGTYTSLKQNLTRYQCICTRLATTVKTYSSKKTIVRRTKHLETMTCQY